MLQGGARQRECRRAPLARQRLVHMGRVYEGAEHFQIVWEARSPAGKEAVWKNWIKNKNKNKDQNAPAAAPSAVCCVALAVHGHFPAPPRHPTMRASSQRVLSVAWGFPGPEQKTV